MNEYDSLILTKLLEKENGISTRTPEQADLIVLNTCAVREKAHTKVYNRLRSLEYLQKKGKKIGVIGCMAQNLREELLYENLPLDFIAGPDSLREIGQYLHGKEAGTHLTLSKTETYEDVIPTVEHHLNNTENKITAFVTIQRGCNNFCTFCVVPYTRGRERSRSVQSIVQEVQNLVDGGIQTVVLLGQNVNSYRYQDTDFVGLVKALLNHTDIERIYFTSPHPKDYPMELIELMAENPRFCNQAHIPLQSGSDSVLKRMKRNYTAKEFLSLIQRFRETVEDVAISTDVIVGFPGETEEDFQQTLEVMEKAEFDSAFMFAYSERKGTIARKRFIDDVPEEVKKRRLNQMIDLQLKRSKAKNEAYVGKTVSVLVEAEAKRSSQQNPQFVGKMRNARKVVFPTPNEKVTIGDYVNVQIDSASSVTLFGNFIGKAEKPTLKRV
ncbi:MAG: tRNA (N6-isopentenyl adenosine(37)-C2)-methylthiotransferase MiaB [Candidatus Hydrogenedentota bacterium]|nr:MAG: tRNA (N6-isopentenyl adenosine(37)-C2)-methylthiotransferase MiaB [Candidatus Hydrogenedentota bacterium]